MPTCFYHPKRETLVSCGRCGRSLCPDCVRHGATGVRCRECLTMPRHVRGLSTPSQLLRAAAFALPLGLAFGTACGWLCWLGWFAGGALGLLVATAAFWGAQRHRDAAVQAIAVGIALLGVAAGLLLMAARLAEGDAEAFTGFFRESPDSILHPAAAAALVALVRFRF